MVPGLTRWILTDSSLEKIAAHARAKKREVATFIGASSRSSLLVDEHQTIKQDPGAEIDDTPRPDHKNVMVVG